jgi:protochlorophyllide reductase
VVNVSSILHLLGAPRLDDPAFHGRRYTPLAAYADSKLAALAFARELERRRGGTPGAADVRFVNVHPGNIVARLRLIR